MAKRKFMVTPKSMVTTKQKARPKAKDVAAALGVSQGTVSNAYNQPNELSAELRDRIFAVAAEMGYSPDPRGRGLRLRSSGLIGLVFAEPLSYAFADPAATLFLRGLAAVTEKAGLGLTLLPSYSHPSAIANAPVDGFIIYSMAEEDPLLKAAMARDLPTIFVDQLATESMPSVTVDDVQGAYLAAQYLLTKGHRHIAIVSLKLDQGSAGGFVANAQQHSSFYPTRERLRGYREALENADISWNNVSVYECLSNSEAEGNQAAKRLLGQSPKPTAVLAMSDQLALGVIKAAKELRLNIPAELSVIGFDDAPLAASCEPSLTTVQQPLEFKGERAGAMLLKVLQSQKAESEVLPVKLIERQSTKEIKQPH
ncbi:MAG: LacI family DNA-binding transcriptional regulator [Trueperaceae bacterium]